MSPKREKEHRRRNLAEFEELARRWIPEEYQRDEAIAANLSLEKMVYFMILDYAMCTGGKNEVAALIAHLRFAIDNLDAMSEDGAANNQTLHNM
jgi:hypothetical protein